jgi:hypothetical protein
MTNIRKMRTKPVPQIIEVIEVLKFEYSTKGIEELKSFCGDDLLSTTKARHPHAIGKAFIKINKNHYNGGFAGHYDMGTIEEGMYLVKFLMDDGIYPMSKKELEERFEDCNERVSP